MRDRELGADERVEPGRGQPAAQQEQAAGQDADGVAGAGPAAGGGAGDPPGHVISGDRELPGDVVRRPGVGLGVPAVQVLVEPGERERQRLAWPGAGKLAEVPVPLGVAASLVARMTVVARSSPGQRALS